MHVTAQSSSGLISTSFDMTGFPQWVKDMRRWEIIAFGSFPFAMFLTTFAMDTYRWISYEGMNFSDQGRRYAPWPFTSAGAVARTGLEQGLTIGIAVGVSVIAAFVDLFITQSKRNKAQRQAELSPPGTTIITTTPYPGENDAQVGADYNSGAFDSSP